MMFGLPLQRIKSSTGAACLLVGKVTRLPTVAPASCASEALVPQKAGPAPNSIDSAWRSAKIVGKLWRSTKNGNSDYNKYNVLLKHLESPKVQIKASEVPSLSHWRCHTHGPTDRPPARWKGKSIGTWVGCATPPPFLEPNHTAPYHDPLTVATFSFCAKIGWPPLQRNDRRSFSGQLGHGGIDVAQQRVGCQVIHPLLPRARTGSRPEPGDFGPKGLEIRGASVTGVTHGDPNVFTQLPTWRSEQNCCCWPRRRQFETNFKPHGGAREFSELATQTTSWTLMCTQCTQYNVCICRVTFTTASTHSFQMWLKQPYYQGLSPAPQVQISFQKGTRTHHRKSFPSPKTKSENSAPGVLLQLFSPYAKGPNQKTSTNLSCHSLSIENQDLFPSPKKPPFPKKLCELRMSSSRCTARDFSAWWRSWASASSRSNWERRRCSCSPWRFLEAETGTVWANLKIEMQSTRRGKKQQTSGSPKIATLVTTSRGSVWKVNTFWTFKTLSFNFSVLNCHQASPPFPSHPPRGWAPLATSSAPPRPLLWRGR